MRILRGIFFTILYGSVVTYGQSCNTSIAVIICKPAAESPTLLVKPCGRQQATIDLDNKFNRQLQQTLVLLRSIVITERYTLERSQASKYFRLKSDCVNFIVVGKDPKVFDELRRELEAEQWDQEFSSMLKLSFVQATYPPKLDWMEDVYRKCSTLRLFLPQILPTVKQIIYVDTDILFLQPPSKLMKIFTQFDSKQLAGITPELVQGNETLNGLYNPQAYNTGVMLMELERMRQTKWSSKVALVAELVLKNGYYGDQDVLIVYFQLHQSQLFDLPCYWNYMPKYCIVDCGTTAGIAAIHGVVGSFYIPPEFPMATLFRTVQEASLNQFSIEAFNKRVGDKLWNLTRGSDNPRNYCARYTHNTTGVTSTFASRVLQSLETLREHGDIGKVMQTKEDGPQRNVSPVVGFTKINSTSFSEALGRIVIAVTLVEHPARNYSQTLLLTGMLKSILKTSPNETFILVIVTDRSTSCEKVNATIKPWALARLELQCFVGTYTKEFKWMNRIFKPGVFFRLFYAHVIPYDAAIHIDTDFVFKSPVRELWSKFSKFESCHILGAAPQGSVKGTATEDFPETPFQAGLMLLNLTRLRNVDWTGTLTMVARILKYQFETNEKMLPVQTLLQLYFKYHPEEILVFEDAWNFIPHYCQRINDQPLFIHAIHGVNDSFTRSDTMEPLFQEIFFHTLNLNFARPGDNDDPHVAGNYSSPCSQSEAFKSAWFN